jgi:digeranylgeranylglycerophospholipid reductase
MVAYDSNYDVIVAGGGPAGLAAAKIVANHGLSVLLAEKHQAFGVPTRTSGGSFVADLQALGIPAHLYHPVTHARLIGPTHETTVTAKKPYGCVLDVRALYQWLAAEAGQAGATLRLRTAAQDILRDHAGHVRGVKLRDHTGQITEVGCRLVIDATGFASTLSVKGGIHPGFKRAGVGAEYDLYAPNWPEDTYALIVGNGIAPAGYAWVFPYGNHRVRAGIGVLRPDVPADPMAYLDLLVGDYPPTAAGLKGAVPIELHDGVIPAEGLREHLVADGIITAGDAAGQSSALVGEGIRFALWAGRLAGGVAADALAAGDVSASALRVYERRWGRQWASKLRHAYTINKKMATFTDDDWDDSIRLLADCAPSDYVRLLRTDLTAAVALGAVVRRPQVLRTVAKRLAARRRCQAAQIKAGRAAV